MRIVMGATAWFVFLVLAVMVFAVLAVMFGETVDPGKQGLL